MDLISITIIGGGFTLLAVVVIEAIDAGINWMFDHIL